MFEIRTFCLAGIFPEKQKSFLIKTRDPKISYVFGVTITYACLVGFFYFVIRIVWSRSFMMSLMNLFSYMLFHFHQNLYHHLHAGVLKSIMLEFLNTLNQISLKWILNPGQDWCEMQMINKSSKDSMGNTKSFSDIKLNCKI